MMEFTKPTTPLTRSSSRRIILEYKIVEETNAHVHPISTKKIHTSPGEGEKNVKWLNKQLREEHDLFIHPMEEKKTTDPNFNKYLHQCGPIINNSYVTISNSQ